MRACLLPEAAARSGTLLLIVCPRIHNRFQVKIVRLIHTLCRHEQTAPRAAPALDLILEAKRDEVYHIIATDCHTLWLQIRNLERAEDME